MYNRYIRTKVEAALQDTPVTIIVGPRQAGKTTLVKQIMQETWEYITLDDANQLAFAKQDPIGFIRHLANKQIIIDEIQRAPEIILSIKKSVDENRKAGRFLITGSANAMLLPKVADSLAGRLEVIRLLPLANCEIQNTPSTFLSKILSCIPPESNHTRIKDELISKVIAGGFPEPFSRNDFKRRTAWFHQYITSIVQKDIGDLAQIEHLNIVPKLIRIMCTQASCLLNYSEVANLLGTPRTTVVRYLQLLEQLFIFQELPAWSRNENKRLVKTPKAHIVDSGLLCALRRIDHGRINRDRILFGNILENYIVCELQRLSSWHDEQIYFYHYRDKDKVEVDIVIETLSGEIIGIEVKASATISKQDFNGLERLKKSAGKDFLMGILLYDGDNTNYFSDKIFSAPIACIWE